MNHPKNGKLQNNGIRVSSEHKISKKMRKLAFIFRKLFRVLFTKMFPQKTCGILCAESSVLEVL